MSKNFNELWDWIKRDFESHPWRLIGECYNWIISVIVAIIFAVTVPNPPLHILYPMWLSGLFIIIACAKSRGSFGLLMGASSMALIDTIGYIRLLFFV
ncbi:MAG: hypothetical protein ACO3UU_17410 [Minisyncoccia bacterium]